jgi:hypothetical protein
MYNTSIDKQTDGSQQMSKTALLKFNEANSKWEASYGGHVFLKSASKDYVVDKIVNQISEKAKKFGVTAVEEIGGGQSSIVSAAQAMSKPVDPELVFGINERFQILEDFVDMVATRTIPSAIIIGEGGLGKSHTVFKALKAAGLMNIDDAEIGARFDEGLSRKAYVVVKGFSTAKGLYRTLFENKNKIVVFDDCDSVLKDPVAANLLKAALDSYDKRVITWNAEAFGDDDLPRSFEFTGGVVFISNMPMYKIPQAIISRSMPADVSMTRRSSSACAPSSRKVSSWWSTRCPPSWRRSSSSPRTPTGRRSSPSTCVRSSTCARPASPSPTTGSVSHSTQCSRLPELLEGSASSGLLTDDA